MPNGTVRVAARKFFPFLLIAACNGYSGNTAVEAPGSPGRVGGGVLPTQSLGQGQACLPPPSGLVAWYAGDTTGKDCADNHDGAFTGGLTAVTSGPGKVANAFSFDGINGGVQIPTNGSIDFAPDQNFTLETWVAVRDEGLTRKYLALLDKHDSSGRGYSFFLKPDTKEIGLQLAASKDIFDNHFAPAPAVLPGSFHHVAVTVDRNEGVRFYVNGIPAGVLQEFMPVTNIANNAPLFLGRPPNPNLSDNFSLPGQLDEVSIYNRALLPTEITSIYAAGAAGKCKAAISAIMGPDKVDAGATVNFTANLTGSNCVSNADINWNASAGVINEMGQWIAPNTPGEYTISATATADQSICSTFKVTVTQLMINAGSGIVPPYGNISVPASSTASNDWNIIVAPAYDVGTEEPGSEADNALLRFWVATTNQSSTGWTAAIQYKWKYANRSDGAWSSANSAIQHLAVRKDISKSGTVSDGSIITVPYGVVGDWNIILSPADMGAEEPGSEGDDALLRFYVTSRTINSQQLQVTSQYKWRVYNGTKNGNWYSGRAHYLLVHKYFSVMGRVRNGECVVMPPGTTMEDWAWIGVANSIGYEEPGSEGDNAILKFSTHKSGYTLCNASVQYKFRYATSPDGFWYNETMDYLLVRKSGTAGPSVSITGPTEVTFPSLDCQDVTWYSNVSGADAPFTYQWFVNGIQVGTESSYTENLCPYDNYTLPLRLVATDSKGKQGVANYSVVIYSNICGDGICTEAEICSCEEDCLYYPCLISSSR